LWIWFTATAEPPIRIEMLRAVIGLGLVMTLYGIGQDVAAWWDKGPKRQVLPFRYWHRKLLVALALGFATSLTLATGMLLAIGALGLVYRFVVSYVLPSAPFVVGLASLLIGSILFTIRLKLRSIYGFTEAVAGVIVAAYQTSSSIPLPGLEGLPAPTANPGYYLAVLTAGVYLIVRGFDNVHQGLRKDPRDPVASAIERWMGNWIRRMRPSPSQKS
jgi:hypothetical protein